MVLEKVLKKYIQEQQSNEFHCYNQNMSFLNRMDQNVAKYWYPNKKWWWFLFVWMVDVDIQGARVVYRINNHKDVFASSFSKTFCQCNFSETFKARQIFRESFRNSRKKILFYGNEHLHIKHKNNIHLAPCLLWVPGIQKKSNN